MEKEFWEWAKKEGLFIDPEKGSVIDEALGRARRKIEDKLRKDKRTILPIARLLGIRLSPWYRNKRGV